MKEYKIIETTDNKYIGSTFHLHEDTNRICIKLIDGTTRTRNYTSFFQKGNKFHVVNSNYTVIGVPI